MDSDLMTTFYSSSSSSSSSSVQFEMEMISNSNGCFSFNRVQNSRSSQIAAASSICVINGTTSKKKTDNSLSSTSSMGVVPVCGIVLSLVLLNLVIILQDFYSSFHCIVSVFKFFLRILSCNSLIASSATPSTNNQINKQVPTDDDHENQITETKDDARHHGNDDDDLCLLELKKVMIIEGLSSKSHNKIAGVFEEEEPSLKEVKDAFDIFDENKDGFIDANELRNVLLCLGFLQETAAEEDCKRMIKAFDDNLDGKIDFNEFIRVMETSLC